LKKRQFKKEEGRPKLEEGVYIWELKPQLKTGNPFLGWGLEPKKEEV
jgi:hypothetical protein